MAKKPTLAQQLADMRADNDRLQRSLIETLRERDGARAALASPDSDKWRLVLAGQAYPDENAISVSWDDLARWFAQHQEEMTAIKTAIDAECKTCGIDMRQTTQATIEDLGTQLHEANEKINALPNDDLLDTWCDWIRETTFDPDEIDRMVELLDLLGLSGNRLNAVLASADIPTALKAYK
jgi:hypothetical protein